MFKGQKVELISRKWTHPRKFFLGTSHPPMRGSGPRPRCPQREDHLTLVLYICAKNQLKLVIRKSSLDS